MKLNHLGITGEIKQTRISYASNCAVVQLSTNHGQSFPGLRSYRGHAQTRYVSHLFLSQKDAILILFVTYNMLDVPFFMFDNIIQYHPTLDVDCLFSIFYRFNPLQLWVQEKHSTRLLAATQQYLSTCTATKLPRFWRREFQHWDSCTEVPRGMQISCKTVPAIPKYPHSTFVR